MYMRIFSFRALMTLTGLFFALLTETTYAQTTVFNPNDPVVTYNPASPPVQPTSGPGKWVRTSRVNWNTSSWKCYIYKGIAFRLKYPKTYVPGNGKKYPLFLFFHGVGESGNIYDNEYQLFHGGKVHNDAVDNNVYDGFLLYPQSSTQYLTITQMGFVRELIENYLIPEVQVDPFRISVDGLSAGGAATWSFFFAYPKLVAAALPISNASSTFAANIEANKFTPVWLFQGALDNNPKPVSARYLRTVLTGTGANFRYTEYPTRGHECWYQAWGEPDYFLFLKSAHKANPWSLGGKIEFCPQETISQIIGVGAGFDTYEWRKDGIIIPGANSNTITATSIGIYDCRVMRGTEWSPWSPIPVELKLKTSYVSPTPEMVDFASKVLPSPDGKTTVQLKVPEGATSYTWTKEGSGTVGSNNIYAAAAGVYRVVVVENSACPSSPSLPFTVINANGPNKPDAITGLIVSKLSKTSLKLNWIINPGANNPTTNFEIYQATKPGGPYQFVGITDASVRAFTKVDLTPGVKYYYVVRAVNNTAGSNLSAEVSQTTDTDVIAPTAPMNLKVVGTTRTSIAIEWDDATDDAGIEAYDIYMNGVKMYTTFTNSFIISNLTYNNLYTISVKARDVSSNESPFSNQVSAQTLSKGLTYKYYTGAWINLPDFGNTQIQKTGFTANVDLNNKTQETQFGFLWEGYIRIPVAGTYNFRTTSADGSKLYFNSQYNYTGTATVDNSGIHGTRAITSGDLTLNAGVYPIAITYFQVNNPALMEVYWKNPQTSGNYVRIPDSAFVEPAAAPTGLPAKPTSLTAAVVSYKKISLSWTDNSNNETAFELFRSEDPINDFAVIAKLSANTVSYQDSTVTAAKKYYYKIRAINQNGESAFDRFGRGVDYYYYHTPTLSVLPNFNSLTLIKSGRTTNFSLGMQERSDKFSIKYEGFINITSTGMYRFYTLSDDGSRLYINGNLIVDNDGPHASTQQSGTINFQNTGLYPITVTYFENEGGEVLNVSYEKVNGSLPKQIIPVSVLGEEYVNITTSVAPPSPNPPYDLHTTNVTKSTARFTWSNSDVSVTKYDVYRSFENNQDYVLYATVSNNFYADTVLFPNSNVFYKVKAVSSTGVSEFSEELTVHTLGETPVLDPIELQYMRYGTQMIVYVNATIATNETISLSVSGLPTFATFASTGNGKGTITFNNPLQSQQGTYNNIVVTALSQQGNSISKSFSLIVNSNNLPIVSGETNIPVGEGQTRQVTFTANDLDAGDNISWSYQGLPNFVSVVNNSATRTSVLTISPLVGSKGTYNVIAKADDGKNGKDTMAFVINVVEAREIYIYFGPTISDIAPSPWNNISKLLTANEVFPATSNPGFKDNNGVVTNVRIKTNYNTTSNLNGETNNSNVGIYPFAVTAAGYRINWSTPTNFTVMGLDKTKKYTFTFLGNVNATAANYTTKYTINTTSVILNPSQNTKNVVKINNVAPNDTGAVIFNVNNAPANLSAYSYINTVVITEGASDAQTIPSKVTNFQIKFEDNAAKLTWTNTATNATGYEVYRANSLMGPYALLNPGASDASAQSYSDNTIQGNKTYYYVVRAKNSVGGNNSANQKVDIPNRAPIIVTTEAFAKTEQTSTITITATDDAGESIILNVSELPSFANFTDNGNGTASLQITPGAGSKGSFNINIRATDNLGASNSAVVKLYVTDKNTSSIFVNFNNTIPVTGVWNSFNKIPNAGAAISNLKNDLGAATSVGVSLVESWTSAGVTGVPTGNNGGAVRDEVLQTFYTANNATTRNIKISGLSTSSSIRYNLIFMSSVTAYDDRTTVYTVGGKTVSVNAANNSKDLVQINGLTADSNGEIIYAVTKPATSAGAYINALIIQSYTSNETLLAPDNFKALAVANNAIRLTWNNRTTGGNVEIYRSTSAAGTYSPVSTVTGNTFTDNGLQKNTEYFYKIKAVNGSNTSPFSNIVSVSTYRYSVYVNFNTEYPAAAPWNNTNSNPNSGDIYNYLKNDENIYSGISMIVGDGFSGSNPFGENTGNNSGVVPDNVMRSSWWVDVSQAAQLRFSGLMQNMIYRFTFFGSRTGESPVRVSTYSINGRIVKLRSSANRDQTVSIDNVYPDKNGEIIISIRGEESSAYMGGLIISTAKIPSAPIDGEPGAAFREQNNELNAGNKNNSTLEDVNLISKDEVKVYPNPFTTDLAIKLSLRSGIQKLSIKVADPSGRVVFLRELKDIKGGTSSLSLGLDKLNLVKGVYIISVYDDNGYITPPVKVIKK